MNTNHYTPIYQIDRFTFCTYLFEACRKKGHTPQEMKTLFIKDCAKRFPTTIDEFVTLEDGTKLGWEFNGDYKITAEYKTPSSRTFTAWKRAGSQIKDFDAGPKVLRKVTDDLSNDKCDYFGGKPGMQAIEAAELADVHIPDAPLFAAHQDQDVGFWGGLLIGGGFLVSEIIGFLFGPKIPAGAFGGALSTDPRDTWGRPSNIL